MTPQFITPCFVHVEDAQKRKELCDNMESLGYKIKVDYTDDLNPIVVASKLGILFDANTFCEVPGYIDCGTNTELFLTLASMRSDTAINQWFKLRGSIVNYDKCDSTAQKRIRDGWAEYATAQEIVEHFKSKTK